MSERTCDRCGEAYNTSCAACNARRVHSADTPEATHQTLEEYERTRPPDPEYADVDDAGQLSIGVAGEQRAFEGLAPSFLRERAGELENLA